MKEFGSHSGSTGYFLKHLMMQAFSSGCWRHSFEIRLSVVLGILILNQIHLSIHGASWTKESCYAALQVYAWSVPVALESCKMEGICGGPEVQPLAQGKSSSSRLLRSLSHPILNISKDGDPTDFLDSLFQHLSMVMVGFSFLFIVSWHFPCSSWCLLPLVLSLCTSGQSLAPTSYTRHQVVLDSNKISPESFKAEAVHLLQPLPMPSVLQLWT